MLKISELTPRYTDILTTGNKYEEDMYDNGIIIANKGDLKMYQTVLAVGPSIRDIKVGDQIMFTPKDYAVMKYDPNSIKNDMDMNKVVKWNLPWVIVEDENGNPQDCLLLKDRDVQFIFKGKEVQGTKNPIITPEKRGLILN